MAYFSLAGIYLIGNEEPPATSPDYGKTTVDSNGGKVRFGINSIAYPEFLPNGFYTTDVTTAFGMAMNFYQTTQWKEISGDQITSQRVASKILDMAVNQGVVEASKLTQRACGTNVDGVIGPATIQAINTTAENIMLAGLVRWWLWLIEQIIDAHPEDKTYEEEWTARAEKLPA